MVRHPSFCAQVLTCLWTEVRYHTSELELTGGALSNVIDSFYSYYATSLLRGVAMKVEKTRWRRGIKDTTVSILGLTPTLPDGRLEVFLEGEGFDVGPLSLVRVLCVCVCVYVLPSL